MRLDAGHVSAHFKLGNELKKMGNLDEAIAEYRAVLRLDPNEGAARYAWAMSLEEKRELVTARKEYKKALKLFPRTAEYQEQVSYIRSALRRLSGAMH